MIALHRRRHATFLSACLLLAVAGVSADENPAAPPAPPAALPSELPPATTPAPLPAVVLRHRFTAGEVARYRVTLEGKGAAATGAAGVSLPLSVVFEAAVTQKVLRVREDGSAEVQASTEVRRTSANGVDLRGEPAAAQSVVVVVTARGQVLELRGLKSGGTGARLPGVDPGALAAITRRLAFPEGPVRTGDSWATEAPDGAEGLYRATTTLVRVEKVDGREVAHLKQTFAAPVGAGRADQRGREAGDLAIRFDVAAGRVLSASGSVDLAATAGSAEGAPLGLVLKLNVRMEEVSDA